MEYVFFIEVKYNIIVDIIFIIILIRLVSLYGYVVLKIFYLLFLWINWVFKGWFYYFLRKLIFLFFKCDWINNRIL